MIAMMRKRIKTLSKIIHIKTGLMNGLRMIMSGYIKDELKIEGKIKEKNDLLKKNELQFKRLLTKEKLNIQKIRNISLEYDLNQKEKKELNQSRKRLTEKIDELIGRITEVHKEIKLFGSLKEKRQQDINEEQEKIEQKMNDESANNQYLRKMKTLTVIILLILFPVIVNAGKVTNQTSSNSSSYLYENQIKASISNLKSLKTKVMAEQKRLQALIKKYNDARSAMEATAKQLENRNYKMIGSIYGNTDPQSSAKSLSLLSSVDAAKILSAMPGRKAGKILSVMGAATASRITLEMIKLGVIK